MLPVIINCCFFNAVQNSYISIFLYMYIYKAYIYNICVYIKLVYVISRNLNDYEYNS